MKLPDPTNNLRVSLKHLALASVLSASFLAGTAQAGTPITWNVAGNGVWDTTTTNWTLDGSTLTTFASDGSEDAIFTAATGGTITISSAMSPASTTVSGGNYTFSGGPLAGTGSLTKSGLSALAAVPLLDEPLSALALAGLAAVTAGAVVGTRRSPEKN